MQSCRRGVAWHALCFDFAASSEEQSASTEQIAAAATSLAASAEKLIQLVSNLRLEREAGQAPRTTGDAVRLPDGVIVPGARISRPITRS